MEWWSEQEKNNGRMLLGYYGEKDGYRPGSFSENLIRCFEVADVGNTQRLFEAFPEWTRPILSAKRSGMVHLRERVLS